MSATAIPSIRVPLGDEAHSGRWAADALFGIPQSLAVHAASALASAQRVRTTLTGFSTAQAVRRAIDDARTAQLELAAALGEMEAMLPAH